MNQLLTTVGQSVALSTFVGAQANSLYKSFPIYVYTGDDFEYEVGN